MKRDIFRLLFKCLIIGVCFAALNAYVYATSPFFDRQKSYLDKVESYPEKSAKVLIVGDSHPGVFKEEMLNRDTYSIAAGGDGVKECYLKLRYILEHSTRIDTVFLTADAQMFSKRRSQSTNAVFLHKYSLLLNSLDVYHQAPLSILAEMVPLFNDNYIEYLNQDLQNIISGKKKEVGLEQHLREDESLWSTRFTAQKRLERAIATGKADHRGVMEDPVLPQYYRKIIDLCVARHIRIIGVRYPAMQAYLAQLPAENSLKLEAFLKELPFETILDYRDFSQDPRLYHNEDHLNEDGARLLLRQMETDIGLGLRLTQK